MRTTRKQIEAVFELWCKRIGGTVAETYSHVNGYMLDNNPIYGGYRIERIVNTSGGVTVLCNRMKPAQFVEAMHFAIESINEKSAIK